MEPDAIINLETAASIQVPSHGEGPVSQPKESLSVQEMRAEGSIEQFLYDRSGQIAGLVLHDGTQVWLPPDVNDQFRHSLHMHDRLMWKAMVLKTNTDAPWSRWRLEFPALR